MDKGFYQAEGLDAQFVVLQARALVTAGLSGNVDFIPIPSGGAQAALSGAAITYIVGESLKSQWTIVVPKSIERCLLRTGDYVARAHAPARGAAAGR